MNNDHQVRMQAMQAAGDLVQAAESLKRAVRKLPIGVCSEQLLLLVGTLERDAIRALNETGKAYGEP